MGWSRLSKVRERWRGKSSIPILFAPPLSPPFLRYTTFPHYRSLPLSPSLCHSTFIIESLSPVSGRGRGGRKEPKRERKKWVGWVATGDRPNQINFLSIQNLFADYNLKEQENEDQCIIRQKVWLGRQRRGHFFACPASAFEISQASFKAGFLPRRATSQKKGFQINSRPPEYISAPSFFSCGKETACCECPPSIHFPAPQGPFHERESEKGLFRHFRAHYSLDPRR